MTSLWFGTEPNSGFEETLRDADEFRGADLYCEEVKP